MSDATSSDKTLPPREDPLPETEGDISALRDIIVGPQKERIDQLESRLDNPKVRTQEISRHLAEAMVLRTGRDDQIAKALEPTIGDAIKASVQKKPQVLADALFPLMGPGIRKAISATIMGMIQSFNQVLNHSVSWQGLKWRIEALRTRKPFAEVVLLHSLVYQVEQVFLIHNQTGLVLNHVVAREVAIQDPDLVSGMLTAIQDFMQDSFSVDAEAGIDTLRVGNDRSVWVEQGGRTTLAAVIRGTPPMDLRHLLRDTLNRLELKKNDDLDRFEGDTSPFAMLDDDLNECLQSKLKEGRSKTSPWLWLILLLVVALTGFWGYQTYQQHQKWNRFVEALRQEPGIVVTRAVYGRGGIVLSGLRDPLAVDPLELLATAGFDPDRAAARWEPYYALDPDFVLQRARTGLDPPAGVNLRLDGDVLVIDGTASHDWIAGARRLAPLIPGVGSLKTEQLQISESIELDRALAAIEEVMIEFKLGSSEYAPDQDRRIERIAELGRRAQDLASRIDRTIRILITGHTDATGAETYNRELSHQRAERVWRDLLTLGVSPRYLSVKGVGASDPLISEQSKEDRERNRRVSFHVLQDSE